jgi:hypothetical protein
MAISTPRVPNDPIGETHSWREFFYRLTTYVAQTSGSFFTGLNFTGSNLASIVTRNHNDLTQIQGGVTGDRHHLTTAQVGLLTYAVPNLVEYNVPVTGFSYTGANTTGILVLDPAGVLATGTIVMPAAPTSNQKFTICSTQVITALTVSPNIGQTVLGAITTIAANGYASWVYRSTNTTWYRIG